MTELEKLHDELYAPSNALVQDLSVLDGDIMILGAGGKMGPSLAVKAKSALMKAGKNSRVMAVSRFSDKSIIARLEKQGIDIIKTELLEEKQLQGLPEVKNIIFMAGTKFGTTGNEPYTWAMNSYLSGRVAEKFRDSRIVVFSTGNVYPYMPADSGGSTEETRPDPVGEYGQSCLGRERIFQYFSGKNHTPTLLFRLNYAIDFRYGVLLEIGRMVKSGEKIDLRTGFVNVIWQGDADEYALRSLKLCSSPSAIFNITGPKTESVRKIAGEFGKRFGKAPDFINTEQPTALLSNASRVGKLLGHPRVNLQMMIDALSKWLSEGGETIDKPTHFQERKGKF
ncbi:MAG TPA: NAD-dependent epimerase/dehydratase family protein [Cyclobacteriaceae bacterium]|nr:NAD-dependent epimerase/dehydratase family protein [Cyclobacteriaceae bacterium]